MATSQNFGIIGNGKQYVLQVGWGFLGSGEAGGRRATCCALCVACCVLCSVCCVLRAGAHSVAKARCRAGWVGAASGLRPSLQGPVTGAGARRSMQKNASAAATTGLCPAAAGTHEGEERWGLLLARPLTNTCGGRTPALCR